MGASTNPSWKCSCFFLLKHWFTPNIRNGSCPKAAVIYRTPATKTYRQESHLPELKLHIYLILLEYWVTHSCFWMWLQICHSVLSEFPNLSTVYCRQHMKNALISSVLQLATLLFYVLAYTLWFHYAICTSPILE